MKKLLLACTLLMPLAAPARASGGINLAQAPIGRMDLSWWHTRWLQTNAAAKADPDAKIIWLGDSITQYWQSQGTLGYDNILPVWNRYYAPYHALDFGFVGDTTASLIWRLDHGQVDGLHPQLAIILIGANNFGHVHWGAPMTIPAIESVVTNVHERLPGAHILLLGVLPSIRSPWVDTQTHATNAALAQRYANSQIVTFVNVAPVLTVNGRTDAALYMDPREVPPRPALHPDATGMARIAAYIQPVVQRYAQ
jgi:lysophospholipase L1-like esterase